VVLDARRGLLGEGHWKTVDARLRLAEALAQQKRTPAQRAALARALGLSGQVVSLYRMGQAAKAPPLARQALAIYKEALGEKHPYYASSLNNLAVLYESMGEHKAALPLYQKALRITKDALGEKHPEYAGSLNNLAGLYQVMGDRKAALPLFKRALRISKEALGERHPSYAAGLNNLAALYADLGDHKAALPLYQKSLQIHKEALGEKHPSYATSLNNLAALYHRMGEYKQALPLFQKALQVRKEALGEKHPSYALSLNNLAGLYKNMGYYKQALPLFKQALQIRKEALGEKHPSYATSINNLASLYQDMGDHKQALPLFKEALAIYKEALGEKHPDYALSLNNLAALYQEMGDRKQALPLAERALAIAFSCLRDNACVQSDRQQFANAVALRVYLNNRLALPDLPGQPSAATHALAWKGAILLRQQQRRLFLQLDASPASSKASSALQAATRRLAALRLSPHATRERLEALEKEQDEAQAELSRLSKAFRQQRERERPAPEAVAKALPEGAVLVDYLFHGSALTAFVHRKGKPVARALIKDARRIELAAQSWHKALVSGKAGTAEGQVLKKLIWSPLEKHLEGTKVVLISPDSVLGTVPFAALPGKKPGTYLIEELAVAVVPVPQALPEMMKRKEGRLAPSLLVAAGLRYDPDEKAAALAAGPDERSAPRTGRESFTRLPATKAEALAVKAAFAELFKDGKAIDLREGDATKSAVKKALGRVRYAHLATHGFFAPETVKSALAPSKGERPNGRPEVTGWHPLLLSGLALSDANREPKPGEEDGILTALEVSEMDLSKLELVVLSACETGLGKAAGGEGLLGMQRAFQVAGARSVVASLWKVDDRATQALMAEFYARAWDTKNIISRAEALRQAQLMLLKEGRGRGIGKASEKVPKGETRLPPLYWAAFVLSGDWR
jgi:CHAT domain-containing protein/Tfp pilus assembly protein PilF